MPTGSSHVLADHHEVRLITACGAEKLKKWHEDHLPLRINVPLSQPFSFSSSEELNIRKPHPMLIREFEFRGETDDIGIPIYREKL